MPADHNAVDSTLGYNFQTLWALVVLLQADDDESVTLELTDDVTLHHSPLDPEAPDQTRYQVAHSINPSLPELTLKSTKLWKTLRIWASEYDSKQLYFLITCAPVSTDFSCLVPDGDRSDLQKALEEEAEQVIEENEQEIHAHKERIAGCRAFFDLTPGGRSELLARMYLCAKSPNIKEINDILDGELRNIARPEKRRLMINRLREYWMNRACQSLTGEAPKYITKVEIQRYLEDLAITIAGSGLPDDYGMIQPPADEQVPDMMRRQIEIVNGGNSRINRAKIVRWKSRNQRQRWLADDVSIASRLDALDQQLIDAWNYRHGPMCDDTRTSSDKEKQQHGCKLLDWSHNDAPQHPVTIGREPVPAFVTQGTYQDLANECLVGWHPDFKAILSTKGDTDCDE